MPSPLITAGKISEWQSLYAADHPWALQAKAFADGTPLDASGIWPLIAYHMTGTSQYITDAKADYFAYFADTPSDRNTSREYSWLLALMHMWLESHFVGGELAASVVKLEGWAESMLGDAVGHGTFSTDSDEVSCHMMGILLIDMALGGNTYEVMDAIGQGSMNVTQMRAEFATYFTKAAGGEWIESGEEYNYGTTMIFILSAKALAIAQFPELEAWLPDFAERLRWLVTQDYTEAVKWGDAEHAHSFGWAKMLPLCCIVAGVSAEPASSALLNFIGNVIAVQTASLPGQYLLWRALLSIDPRDIPSSPTAENLSGTNYASGVGHVIRKVGNHHFEFFGCHALDVHHQWNATNVRWSYTSGGVSRYVLDMCQGYGTSHTYMSTPLMYGLPFMYDRDIVSVANITGGIRATWHTEGERYPPPFYDPPPAFGTLDRVIDFMDAGTVTCTDTFTGSAPTNTSRYLYYGDQYHVENATHPLIQLWHFPHATAEPTPTVDGYSISLPGGNVLSLVTNSAAKRCDQLGGGVDTGYYTEGPIDGLYYGGYIPAEEREGYVVKLGASSTITTSFSLGEPAGFTSSRSFRQLLRRR